MELLQELHLERDAIGWRFYKEVDALALTWRTDWMMVPLIRATALHSKG